MAGDGAMASRCITVVAAAVVLLQAVSSDGVAAGDSVSDLQLNESLGRAGHSVYQATMTFLLDKLYPPDTAKPESRSGGGGYNKDMACMGAVYRRSGGGSVCVDAVTAAAVVGGALLLQFLFYALVTAACPSDVSLLTGHGVRNITYVINVDNSNMIDVQMEAGDQDLMQTQDQTQGLTQTQTQTQAPTQTISQSVSAPQTQEQLQRQVQSQDDTVNSGIRRRQESLDDDDLDYRRDCVDPQECENAEDVYPKDPEDPPATREATGDTVEETQQAGKTNERARLPAQGQAKRRRRWTVPQLGVANLDLSNLALSKLGLSDLSFSLCPALGLYLGR